MAEIGDKYAVGEKIGGGGMAEVFRGVFRGAEGFERPVAIKRMLRRLSSDPSFGEMFINEARLASLLQHPSIAAVLDFDRDRDNRHYLVMELVDGVDLRELVSTGRLPVEVVAYIIGDVLRALDYAHELEVDGRHLGIVHRDVSPHNVMLSWSGGIKLVDFGIAKAVSATMISRSGSLKGKTSYMSPEQAHGQTLDGRSDLFAVGVMLHELLTGDRLFRAGTDAETLALMLNAPIAVPSSVNSQVPPALDAVTLKLLERDRERRYASAHEAREALLGSEVITARAGLELERLLIARFPQRAPRRRGASLAGTADDSDAAVDSSTLSLRGGSLALADTLESDSLAVPPPPRSAAETTGESAAKPPFSPSQTIVAADSGARPLAVAPRQAPSGGERAAGGAERAASGAEQSASGVERAAGGAERAAGGAERAAESGGAIDSSAGAAALKRTFTAHTSTGSARRLPTQRPAVAAPGEDISPTPRRGKWMGLAAAAAVIAAGLAFALWSAGGDSPETAPPGQLASTAAADAAPDAAAAGGEVVTKGETERPPADARPRPGGDAAGPADAAPPEPTASGTKKSGRDARVGRESAPSPGRPPRENRADAGGANAEGPLLAPATLILRTSPWALIKLDGRPAGQTPKVLTLAPGRHSIELFNPEIGKTKSFQIRLEAGKTREVHHNLADGR